MTDSSREVAYVAADMVVLTLRQGDTGVGRGDLDDLGGVEDGRDRAGDRRVEGADDADDVLVTRELGGGVLADVRVGLVVLGRDLDLPALEVTRLVGFLDREVDRVLDALAEGGEVARERSDDADLDDLLVAASGAAGAAVAVAAAGTAGRQGQGGGEEQGPRRDDGTLGHVSSW